MKKVLIWGIGQMATKLIEKKLNAEIIGFIQTKKNEELFMGYKIYELSNIPPCDYIFVANTYSDQIYEKLVENNISLDNVVFLYKGKNTAYRSNAEIEEILGEVNLTMYKAEYGILEGSFFEKDKETYSKLNERKNFAINENNLWPIISDKYAEAGSFNNYFLQDLWAAKQIIKSGVKKHFDIGSRLDGFIAHLLAANIDVTMIDVRKFPGDIEGLDTIVDDATTLHQFEDDSIESLSALCSIEHFGLGRYGDPIDPEACFKCFKNIQRVMKKGGKLYLALPIGSERVEFNAHRIFYPQTVVDCFDELKLIEFSCAAVKTIEYNVPLDKYNNDPHNGEFRYGLFSFVKCEEAC